MLKKIVVSFLIVTGLIAFVMWLLTGNLVDSDGGEKEVALDRPHTAAKPAAYSGEKSPQKSQKLPEAAAPSLSEGKKSVLLPPMPVEPPPIPDVPPPMPAVPPTMPERLPPMPAVPPPLP